jgi:hypothetical protein
MFDYGNLFSPRKQQAPTTNPHLGEAGSICSVPGSVIHAGPASASPRAIIFFTCGFLWRKNKRERDQTEIETRTRWTRYKRNTMLKKETLYSKYDQYNVVTLFIEIMSQVWSQLDDQSHKEFLLVKLHELIIQEKFVRKQHGSNNLYVLSLENYLDQCSSTHVGMVTSQDVVESQYLLKNNEVE